MFIVASKLILYDIIFPLYIVQTLKYQGDIFRIYYCIKLTVYKNVVNVD